MTVDYRDLLVKYIGLVGEAEGVDFIPPWCPDGFTEEEHQALQQASAAAVEAWRQKHGKGEVVE